MNEKTLRELERRGRRRIYAPGEMVIRAGDRADSFHVIVGGRAGVAGRELLPALREGDCFGEIGVVDGQPRSATVIALEELRTVEVARPAFLDLLARDAELARSIMASLGARIRRLERGDRHGPSAWPVPGLN